MAANIAAIIAIAVRTETMRLILSAISSFSCSGNPLMSCSCPRHYPYRGLLGMGKLAREGVGVCPGLSYEVVLHGRFVSTELPLPLFTLFAYSGLQNKRVGEKLPP